jgi:hypothetical protein
MDFSQILKDKIEVERKKLQELNGMIRDPSTHASLLQKQMEGVSNQVSKSDLTLDDLKSQVVGVFNEISNTLLSNWQKIQDEIDTQQKIVDKMVDILRSYEAWDLDKQDRAKKSLQEEKERKKREKELKKKIDEGEIKEPSQMTAVRRKKGTKPPIGLKKYRNLKSSEDSSE